MSRDRVEIKRH